MKLKLKWFFKLFLATALAGLCMSSFSYLYYNPPIHVPTDNGVTDYKREESIFWSRWAEGVCQGTLDSNGYNNESAIDNPDILIMGDSHIEGLYVNDQECIGNVLNHMMKENNLDMTAYNIGMSSHYMVRNTRNLEKALETYKPKYVVLQTRSLIWPKEEVSEMLNGEYDYLTAYDKGGLMFTLQKNPYLKLLYLQYKNAQVNKNNPQTTVPQADTEKPDGTYELMQYVSQVCEKYDVTPIVLYMPYVALEQDMFTTTTDAKEYATLVQACAGNNIHFLDMTDGFEKLWVEEYRLPYGFVNTQIGYGHLNKYGHECLAEAIYQKINELN